MTTIDDGAFLADDTMVASYELRRRVDADRAARIGKRAFLGNSGIAAPGRAVPKRGARRGALGGAGKSKPGTSWLGSPAGAAAPRRLESRREPHLPAARAAARRPRRCGSSAGSCR